jgi:four helix bundle protein
MKMLSEIDQKNPIVRHSFEFALLVEAYCEHLREQKKFDLARQLFRAGTSIGANIWEAQESESRADFIHKMKIALKEAREALFWLLLCKHSKGYPVPQELLDKLAEIRRILSAIIHTSKQRIPIIKVLLSIFGL